MLNIDCMSRFKIQNDLFRKMFLKTLLYYQANVIIIHKHVILIIKLFIGGFIRMLIGQWHDDIVKNLFVSF